MTIYPCLERVVKAYAEAKQDKSITKPCSYALYHVWLWADAYEKPRKNKEKEKKESGRGEES